MKLLLVEDNPGDVRLLQETLKETSGEFILQVAPDLATALRLLATQEFDLLLLDLGLPDSAGVQTLARLQARETPLPIVIMTSLDDEAVARQALEMGAQDYLVKGQADSRLLQRSLRYAVGRHQADRAVRESEARYRDRLEETVRERTAELEQAMTALNEQMERSLQDEQEMRALSERVVAVQEEEHRSIARALHDEVGQYLTFVQLMLERAMKSPSESAGPVLTEAREQVAELIRKVRNLSLLLRPSMLDDLGLTPALLWLFDQYRSQSGLQVNFTHDHVGTVSSKVNTAAYRIIQAALTNVMRHSGAKEASVRVWSSESALYVSVEDKGCGFDMAGQGASPSTGISGMRERARSLGGKLTVESAPGAGTRILAELPLVYTPPPAQRRK